MRLERRSEYGAARFNKSSPNIFIALFQFSACGIFMEREECALIFNDLRNHGSNTERYNVTKIAKVF